MMTNLLDFNSAQVQNELNFPTKASAESQIDPIGAFSEKLIEYGLTPDSVVADGAIHRFGASDNCYYSLHQGKFFHGIFGDWAKSGSFHKWCSGKTSEMSAQDISEHKKILQENREKLSAIKKEKQGKTRIKAKIIWDGAIDAVGHDYLRNKNVKSFGLKVSGNELLIPLRDEKGVLHSLQRISGNSKKFLPGGRVTGCSHTIKGDNTIYLCEGYATGATIHEATAGTVIVAFNSENLKKVAKQIKGFFTICADNDQWKPDIGNIGIKAAEAAKSQPGVNAIVVFPTFKSSEGKPTDFNDLANMEGIKTVKSQLINNKVGDAPNAQPWTPQSTSLSVVLKKPPPPQEFIADYGEYGFIPKGIVGVITATGGTGKSFLLAQFANMLSRNGKIGQIKATKKAKVLFVAGEDDQNEIYRRFWNICAGKFQDNLYVGSTFGSIGPLMKLENGNPVRAEGFDWLETTIKNHEGLEILILDPKSRFYGLDENSSDHGTRWIQTLEYLAKEYNLTILFSHHTSKTGSTEITQNMSRGSSAIVDGCRWQAGMVRLDDQKASELKLSNPRLYVEFSVPKSNYAPDMPSSMFFRRNKHGVLRPVDLTGKRHELISEHIKVAMGFESGDYSVDDMAYGEHANDFYKEMKEKISTLKRDELPDIVNLMADTGVLEIIDNKIHLKKKEE